MWSVVQQFCDKGIPITAKLLGFQRFDRWFCDYQSLSLRQQLLQTTVWLTCWTVVFLWVPWDMPPFVVYRVFYLYVVTDALWGLKPTGMDAKATSEVLKTAMERGGCSWAAAKENATAEKAAPGEAARNAAQEMAAAKPATIENQQCNPRSGPCAC